MPRQLPWKVHNSGTPKQAAHSRAGARHGHHGATPASSASVTRSPAPSSSHITDARSTPKPKSETTPRRNLGNSNARSPSTSPPHHPNDTEPIPEELMREGIHQDDRYRMVEDEFLAIAHDFTRHIHAAEYQRLKSLALKSQNEETILNISRPVTGEMTEMVKRRHAALDNVARQRRALGRKRTAESDSEEEDDEEEQTGRSRRRIGGGGGGSSLQGLMDSPRKKAVPLTSFSSNLGGGGGCDGSPASRRRQDTQTHSRREEPAHIMESSSEDDDLDGGGPLEWLPKQTSKSAAPVAAAGIRTTSNLSSRFARSTPADNPLLSKDITARSTTHQQAPHHRPSTNSHTRGENETEIKQEDDDDDGDDDFFSRIRSRRAEMRRRSAGVSRTGGIKTETTTEGEKDTFSLDDIPSFL